jgi:hypothetical protein
MAALPALEMRGDGHATRSACLPWRRGDGGRGQAARVVGLPALETTVARLPALEEEEGGGYGQGRARMAALPALEKRGDGHATRSACLPSRKERRFIH